jgi:phosphatidylserine decarboxylase
MPIYVRIGMQALYHGKEQARLLGDNHVEEMLKVRFSLSCLPYCRSGLILTFLQQQSIKQGVAYDNPVNALSHIESFVKQYEIDTSELLKPNLADYRTFNEFFYRALKAGARPVAEEGDAKVVSSAADCRLTVFESVEAAKTLWIKVCLPSLDLCSRCLPDHG